MSTPICDFRRRGLGKFMVLAALLAPLLAGCVDATKKSPPLEAVSLFQGEVVVAGPEGYCIDKGSLKQRAQGSFVLLASCESLTGKYGRNVPLAVMTVSVLPKSDAAELPKPAELAGASTPLEALQSDNLSLVYLPRGGNQFVPGGDPRYWRAGLVLNGHMIGLAVYGLAGSAASKEAGKQLIMGLAERLRSRSPAR